MKRYKAKIPVDGLGYRWVDGADPRLPRTAGGSSEHIKGKLYLLGRSKDSPSAVQTGRLDFYDPIATEPALYRVFAGLDRTPEAILGFANEYGHLAGLASLEDWQNKIAHMKRMGSVADRLIALGCSGKKPSGKVAAESTELIRRVLDQVQTAPTAEINEDGTVGLYDVAYDLWSALNIQLVEAIADRKQYRPCDECGKPIEISPTVNRTERAYCSNSCRVKAYRERKKDAVLMRNLGKKVQDIQKVLGSDIDTILKWVDEEGGTGETPKKPGKKRPKRKGD